MDAGTLIQELEDALPSRTMAERAQALRRVTDLFLFGASGQAPAQIAVFDDVMMRLMGDIETSIRAELSLRLAAIPNVPPKLIRRLATDTEIAVAGPVLRSSPALDDDILVHSARTAAQDHLLAISCRAAVSEPVTDELVERGDRRVALSVVGNAGARLSERGRTVLVERSRDDDQLAAGIWSRPDVPHQHLLRLLAIASDNVRRTLEALDHQRVNLIRNTMAEVSNTIQRRIRVNTRDYTEAERTVTGLHGAGDLTGARIEAFAASGQFEETTLALALLCDLPVGACERAMVQDRAELILLITKAAGLTWETTKAVLRLRDGTREAPAREFEADLATFSRLRQETARKAIQFVRMRERAGESRSAVP